MEGLPDELVDQILNYLDPTDIVILQQVSKRFLRLARDSILWRFQAYYDCPTATLNRIGQTPSLQGHIKLPVSHQHTSNEQLGKSNKVRATEEWDLSDPSEKVDWYSEYIARHAPLSARWFAPKNAVHQDIRGVSLFEDGSGKKIVGPLEDGSLGIWNLDREKKGPSRHRRISGKYIRSSKCILFGHSANKKREASHPEAAKTWGFPGVAECISIDAPRHRAYIAVRNVLNEVDLTSLQVVSQTEYAWLITALSKIEIPNQSLTVGTTSSLHLVDPRVPSTEPSGSSSTRADTEDQIAFFPNKDRERQIHPAKNLQFHPFGGFGTADLDRISPSLHPTTTSSVPVRRGLLSFARVEPSPLSILHQTDHSIMVAGRFPSILNYDRRFFPRLQYVIHSSARLSSLAYLPFSLCGVTAASTTGPQGTLISCGEYNGRGSLELYSVPHTGADADTADHSSGSIATVDDSSGSIATVGEDYTSSPGNVDSASPQLPPGNPFYKNRQTVSSSKLLSVAPTGTRIVFSDADGGLKWVERDGRSVVRRWNINHHQLQQEAFRGLGGGNRDGRSSSDSLGPGRFGASTDGEEVVRKIIPTGPGEADDLLVWTGERIGLVSVGRREEDEEEGEEEGGEEEGEEEWFDAQEEIDGARRTDGLEEKAEEYARQMRRAFERQTSELNWMKRFGFGSS